MDYISYCDGSISLMEVAEIINVPFLELKPIVDKLVEQGLLKKLNLSTI